MSVIRLGAFGAGRSASAGKTLYYLPRPFVGPVHPLDSQILVGLLLMRRPPRTWHPFFSLGVAHLPNP